MQIELIGCTSAGKSTLAATILQTCRRQGIDIVMGDDFVLNQIRLNWVKNRTVRTLLVDTISIPASLLALPKNLDFYVFALRIVLALPVALCEKLNLARNVIKKVGIYEIVDRYGSSQQVVLVDEGTLHVAHNLFVHVSVQPNFDDLSTFVRLVRLPDAAVYVAQREAVLIARTLERGHKRIPDGSYAQVERFIARAVDTFNMMAQQPTLQRKLLLVDGEQKLTAANEGPKARSLDRAWKIVSAGVEAMITNKPVDQTANSPRQTDDNIL